MELLRIVDACVYAFYYLVFIRSPAEYKIARMMVVQEFPLGVFYSQFLLIFTMTIIFSFASPLIVPCGLLFTVMLIKMEYSLVSRFILFIFICVSIYSLIKCFCPNFMDRRRLNKRELGQQQSAIEISRQQQQQQQQTSTSLSSAPTSAERNQNSKNEICICSYTWPVFN
ncbi:hypothetical protein BLA29_005420 [Euroglyphus maynei]|uniref:CSC1/OSCA1-like 7TM region domain-containing protein n=1 Tax=Euroglyphus maynei TaxID=6958 RepID=A0A1Y3AQV9_EURMA|nr:hypothetical protein BLA29_005420 [Euroglyphus maynei]